MKIAIIGAGGAGLCAGRHCLKENFIFDIFEQTGNVGGTWNYTDQVGLDENGIPIQSSMYKGLKTNLPKELMAYEDYPYPEQEESFLPQDQVLEYIKDFTAKFQLERNTKFYTRVLHVEPHENLWSIEFENVKTKIKQTDLYDAVIVCNGHYSVPYVPKIFNSENFVGNISHSHDYRTPDSYQNKVVLVLGAGPSGVDISQQIAEVAKKVYLSYPMTGKSFLPLPKCLNQKPLVSKLTTDEAIFEDGTCEKVDDILFCTGYKFSFPFLSDKCGVKCKNNYVDPLFKQIININNPTMAFIGLPITVCPFPLFDIQVRFFLSTLNGHYKLPAKEKMMEDLNEYISKIHSKPMKKYHYLGETQGNYFDELSETANIKRVPPVINKLYNRVRMNRNLNDCYKIVDEENWEQIR